MVDGLDEPGLAFESWWYIGDPTTTGAAVGTNTGLAATDQRETATTGAGIDLGAIVGATRTVDATSGSAIPAGSWTHVEIRTDETGTSAVWLDDVSMVPPTAHATGESGGSAGLRVGALGGGGAWHVDDVVIRRYVSSEPTTSLGALDRQ